MHLEKRLVITYEAIQKRIAELASEISSDYKDKETVLVAMLNGAVFFFADLAMRLTIPDLKIDFLRVSSYGSGMKSSGTVNLVKDLEVPVEGKSLLIVEDIVDTGLTISRVMEHLAEKNPQSIRICALIDKTERREVEVPVDYCGFRIEKGFLVGYGLDYNEQFRCLKNIYSLHT